MEGFGESSLRLWRGLVYMSSHCGQWALIPDWDEAGGRTWVDGPGGCLGKPGPSPEALTAELLWLKCGTELWVGGSKTQGVVPSGNTRVTAFTGETDPLMGGCQGHVGSLPCALLFLWPVHSPWQMGSWDCQPSSAGPWSRFERVIGRKARGL